MKKYAANIITSIRILLAPFLMFFDEISVGFLVLFSLCGVTDLIDGPIARATGTTSQIGSVLDTIGDFLVFLSVFKVLFFSHAVPLEQIIIFASAMTLHLAAAVYAKFKFRKFYFVHNMLSKVLGCLIFVVPFVFYFTERLAAHISVIIVVAAVAGVESILIVALSLRPNPDYKYLHSAIKDRKAIKEQEAVTQEASTEEAAAEESGQDA
ncbi:MAG: CDP-alcohol phosphatidyltransferase family protein [Lachnospiraceae bacterium]|nr:CDP-alcohol phosphatidyltransferase family protein [Lachnospiraceae bacterium]